MDFFDEMMASDAYYMASKEHEGVNHWVISIMAFGASEGREGVQEALLDTVFNPLGWEEAAHTRGRESACMAAIALEGFASSHGGKLARLANRRAGEIRAFMSTSLN
jgi:hypothetical protein